MSVDLEWAWAIPALVVGAWGDQHAVPLATDEADRNAHLAGRVAAALGEKAADMIFINTALAGR
jgi:hypothetical protein